MSKLYFTIIALLLSVASFAIPGISGPSVFCISSSAFLTDSTSGGTWTSSNTAVATVGGVSGMVTGVAAGSATITYTVGSAFVVHPVTVISGLPPILGPSVVCTGSTITLTDGVSGGIWTGTTSIASVDTGTGVVTGLSVGTVTIYYSVGSGCSFVSKLIDVIPGGTVSSISGPTSVCIGASITLTDSTSGGVWSSTANATITSLGVLTGVAGGWDTVRYTVTGSCGTATATYYVDINNATAGTIIAGPDSLCIGSSNYVFDSVSGGTWTSSNPSVITVDAFGNISGVSSGTATISYTYTTCSSTHTAIKLITVSMAPPAITGGTFVAVGGTLALHDILAGGMWTTSDSTKAPINHTTGLVTGVTPGVVTITYTVDSGCIVTATITVGYPSAIMNPGTANPQISIFPNPAEGFTNIQWENQLPGNATILLADLTGREVYNAALKMNSINGYYNIDLSGIKQGVYLLLFRSALYNYYSRLVIEK